MGWLREKLMDVLGGKRPSTDIQPPQRNQRELTGKHLNLVNRRGDSSINGGCDASSIEPGVPGSGNDMGQRRSSRLSD